MHIKKPLTALSAILILASCGQRVQHEQLQQPEEKQDTIYPLGFCTDSFAVEMTSLRNGETFTNLMHRLGMEVQDAVRLSMETDSVFSMKKLRAGNAWSAYYDTVSTGRTLRYAVYSIDKTSSVVFNCAEPFAAWTAEKPVEIQRGCSDITINTSLWVDMKKAGAHPSLIVALEDVFAWTVDFFSLQKGDRFRLIYEQKVCEGEVIGAGNIPYGEFISGGKVQKAIYFDQGDGGNTYWTPEGESMKRAFLKAPLKFSRISSGFSYHRKHPVTGKVKAHTAVDYAAPTGTPVMSIGDGKVIFKGWTSGGGNTVKIQHNSQYVTSYMHLSKFAPISNGTRVRQGEVIGYVGATGVATGPHLDFRVYKNGTPINPLKMDSPKTDPISPDHIPALDSLSRMYSHKLDSLLK